MFGFGFNVNRFMTAQNQINAEMQRTIDAHQETIDLLLEANRLLHARIDRINDATRMPR